MSEKIHKGIINHWHEDEMALKEGTLPYRIFGFLDDGTNNIIDIVTSRVIKREGNEIETYNSFYTLGTKRKD